MDLNLPAGTYNTTYAKDMALIRTRWQGLLTLAALALLFTAPMYVGPYMLGLMNTLAILVIATLGIQILLGYAGQVSMAHAAFVAVGAYTSAILTAKIGLPYWLTLIAAGLVSGVVGVIIGGPSLRIKGFYLVMSSLAGHQVILYIIGHWDGLTGGMSGMRVPQPVLAGIRFDSEAKFFYLFMPVLVLAICAAMNMMRTRAGRAMVAVRDNEIAAEVMGINVWYVKLQAFFVGCSFAGIAGALYAPWAAAIGPAQFPIWDGIWYIVYVMIGGTGTIIGPFLGAVVVVMLREVLAHLTTSIRPDLVAAASAISDIVFGVLIAVMMLFQPRGIAHGWKIFKAYYRRWPLAR